MQAGRLLVGTMTFNLIFANLFMQLVRQLCREAN